MASEETSKSIFEEEAESIVKSPTADTDNNTTNTTDKKAESTLIKSSETQPEIVDTEEEEEKKEELKLDESTITPTDDNKDSEEYPTNSLNDAKAKYLKNKYREQHKYEGGASPRASEKGQGKGKGKSRRKSKTQAIIEQLGQKVDQVVDDMKQQILPQIQNTGDKLLHATDDAMKSLSQSTGIKFAPVNIPLKRRRQTFAVVIWSCGYIAAFILNFIAFRYWTGWKFYLYLLYLAWKLMYQTFHKDGGLPIPWFRNAIFFKWFCDYFPIRLHKLYDLDDTGETSYLFGYHPHGIIGMGAVGTFAMMASGFHKLFPGVDVRLLTLRLNFYIPFFDLLITFLGLCDASRESCNAILADQDEHKSLCLVLGGAKESLEANPGVVKLFLKRRKGFVKVALENGATLVPVFGFGENELFDQVDNPQGSLVRKIQNQLQSRLGFAFPLFHGRGIFQYDYGMLPKRRPIDVVFGKPVPCPKMTKETITPEIIDKYHVVYCNELKNLFDQEKGKYYGEDEKLPEMLFI